MICDLTDENEYKVVFKLIKWRLHDFFCFKKIRSTNIELKYFFQRTHT